MLIIKDTDLRQKQYCKDLHFFIHNLMELSNTFLLNNFATIT